MSKNKAAQKAKEIYKTADVIAKELTGRNFKDLLKTGIVAMIDVVESKVQEEDQPAIVPVITNGKLAEAYRALHCVETDDDSKIMGWFQELVKILHPEIGSKPDQVEFFKVCDSYNFIMQCRHPEFNRPEEK